MSRFPACQGKTVDVQLTSRAKAQGVVEGVPPSTVPLAGGAGGTAPPPVWPEVAAALLDAWLLDAVLPEVAPVAVSLVGCDDVVAPDAAGASGVDPAFADPAELPLLSLWLPAAGVEPVVVALPFAGCGSAAAPAASVSESPLRGWTTGRVGADTSM